MSGGVKRSARVAERLREEIAALLRGLRDPRVMGALVSRVEVTDDLQSAKVYVRRELGAGDEHDQRELVKGLTAASGKLRRDVAHALALRYAPTLRFFYDDAQDAMSRVEELLREIKQGEPGKE
jgi:ribosome-binding factor A